MSEAFSACPDLNANNIVEIIIKEGQTNDSGCEDGDCSSSNAM